MARRDVYGIHSDYAVSYLFCVFRFGFEDFQRSDDIGCSAILIPWILSAIDATLCY